MEVIAAGGRAGSRADRIALVRGFVAAILMLVVGGSLAWVLLATPVLSMFEASPRPSPGQTVAGMIAWGLAILLPGGFLVLGLVRAMSAIEYAANLRPNAQLPKLARELGEGHVVATGLRLPDGRWIPELVLGPFGLAVVATPPPPAVARRVGTGWEMRDRRGHWTPMEDPRDRAARDAERVRRWLSGHDRDFVVKVHAALVTTDPSLGRTQTCAVLGPKEVAAWLRALPPQRGLTPARHDHLVELMREVADSRR